MIDASPAALRPEGGGQVFNPETLRQKINSDEYIHDAIQRIAQVLSNEILKMSQGGIYHVRQRKRRK